MAAVRLRRCALLHWMLLCYAVWGVSCANVPYLGLHEGPCKILPGRQCLSFVPVPIAGTIQKPLCRVTDVCWPPCSSPLSYYAIPDVAPQEGGGPWGHPTPHGGSRSPRIPRSRFVTGGSPPGVPRQARPGSDQQAPSNGAPSFYPNQTRRKLPLEGSPRNVPRGQQGPFGSLRPQAHPSMHPVVAAPPSYPRSPTGFLNHQGGSRDSTGPAGPQVRSASLENLQGATAAATTAEQRFPLGLTGSRSFPFTGRKQGRDPSSIAPVNGDAQRLQAGQQVEAICIRVWSRYALFRLVPRFQGPYPDSSRKPPGLRPTADIGFLHVSSLKKGGRFLPSSEHGRIDLTQVLSVGATYTVDLLGAPSAATSHRWQVAFNLPHPEKSQSSSGSLRREPPQGPSQESLGDVQEGPLTEDSPPQPSQEFWSDYDPGLLLDEEEAALRKALPGLPNGPNSGRRRRSVSDAPREDIPKKRQGPREDGGWRGRGKGGGRRSGRGRDGEEAEEEPDAFLVTEASEEDPTIEEGVTLSPALGDLDSPATLRHPYAQGPVRRPAEGYPSAPKPATPNNTAVTSKTRTKVKASGPSPSSRSAQPSRPVALKPRAAVVTVLGHVDHGKTTLLRALRLIGAQRPSPCRSAAAQSKSTGEHQEAGCITQRIGVFEVPLPEGTAASFPSLTLLDTPGHEAFSCMRLRAAKAADFALLVVAANEGVQQETRRCWKACQELNLPVLVVLTKTDLGGSYRGTFRGPLVGDAFLGSPEGAKTLGALAAEGILTEPLGGSVQVAAVSAKGFLNAKEMGDPEGPIGEDAYGIQHLLECIALQAEVLELRAKADGPGKGLVLESHCSAAHGGSASILLKEGTLKVGDWLVVGPSVCHVRRLRRTDCPEGDRRGSTVKPGVAEVLEVFGFSGDSLPTLGEEAIVVRSEEEAKTCQESFLNARNSAATATAAEEARRRNLERLYAAPKEEAFLPVSIRADAHGTAAAVAAALERLAAQRDDKGVWRLCPSEGPLQSPQGSSRGPLQAEEAPATEENSLLSDQNASPCSISNGEPEGRAEPPIRRVRVLRALAGVCSAQDVHACMDDDKKGGLVVAFATKVSKEAKKAAAATHVQLVHCDVIYEAIEAVEKRLQAPNLFPQASRIPASGAPPESHANRAIVKQIFHLSNGSVVAGCDVVSGRLRRGAWVRILGQEGVCKKEAARVFSLRVGKESRETVASPAQCGIICEDFTDWHVGDSLVGDDQQSGRHSPA